MPVGQSLAHPLQARQRSSASCTSGDPQSGLEVPLISSWSTRALPRVESFSSLVARYDGHIRPPPVPGSARHLPTPVQRCTARAKSPASSSYRSPSALVTGTTLRARRASSRRAGATMMPGFSRLAGSKTAFTWDISSRAAGEYIRASSSLLARPSPCSPESEPPCATTRSAASERNLRNRVTPSSESRSKSSRTWMHPSPKCPYG